MKCKLEINVEAMYEVEMEFTDAEVAEMREWAKPDKLTGDLVRQYLRGGPEAEPGGLISQLTADAGSIGFALWRDTELKQVKVLS